MDLVAGPASAALFLVDVDEVQVFLTISESSQGRRFLMEYEGFLVALKAQVVGLHLKWTVEFGWKIML